MIAYHRPCRGEYPVRQQRETYRKEEKKEEKKEKKKKTDREGTIERNKERARNLTPSTRSGTFPAFHIPSAGAFKFV